MVLTGQGSDELAVRISGDATGATQAIQNVIGRLGGLRAIAPLAGAALAGALGVKSVNAARSFQDAMNESVAIMSDVSDAMRTDMANAAREVATTTRFSADEAAESYFFLASAGLDARESIEALPQVAEFAQAGMFDMATATDLLTDAQSALGRTMADPQENMEEMAKLSDILVKANTLANASVEQFSEALTNKAAPAMRNNNIATEEGVAVLAAFADAGLKGRRAGTILARTIQGLQKRATENADAFEEYGISVFDANDEMRSFADISADLTAAFEDMSPKARAAAFEQLGFNRRSRRGINLLIDQEDALREYTDGLEDAGGTTEAVANRQMESFNAQLDVLKSQLNDVAIGIGNAMLPSLTNLVSGLSTSIEAARGWGQATSDALDRINQAFARNNDAIDENQSHWQDWADALATDVADKVDFLAAGVQQLAVALVGQNRALNELLAGDLEGAQEAIDTTFEEMRALGEARDRRSERRFRTVGAQGVGTPEDRLIGGGGGDGEDAELPDEQTTYQDEMLATQEDQKRVQQGILQASAEANRERANSALFQARDPCDLRDALLEPFERAPRPAPTGGAETTRRDERSVSARDVDDADLRALGGDPAAGGGVTDDGGDLVITVGQDDFARVAKKSLARHQSQEAILE